MELSLIKTRLYIHPKNQCGSELAREFDVTVNINAECYILFASKLAPTVGIGVLWIGDYRSP
ncbi:hypothetical protein BK669_09190 [Pseudomonas fluorescens]|jgi:glucosamine 6-phosphate synthetase-like amidotransferase/phosphosugar isomerase protein|nr:hypothetical protein BK669_09190 [Pseudomonas fluorescens]